MKTCRYYGSTDGHNYNVVLLNSGHVHGRIVSLEVREFVASLLPMAKIAGAAEVWGNVEIYFEVNLNDDLTFHSFVV